MRWEQQRGLPIHRVPGGQRHAVFAFRQELDEWLKRGSLDHDALVEQPEYLQSSATPAHFPFISQPNEPAQIHTVQGSGPLAIRTGNWISHRNVLWITLGAALLVIVGYIVRPWALPTGVRFTEITQLTSDSEEKEGLVTDGETLYFGEHQGSRIVLSSISMNGGPIRTIQTPFVQAIPEDISPDGKSLLVLAWEGVELERALWVVPAGGGAPLRMGQIQCHSAAWSPDGRHIAFAAQNTIYLTDNNGASIQQVQAFDAIPEHIRWSPDGRRVRFIEKNRKNATSSIWDVTFSNIDKAQVSSLVPLQASLAGCWTSSLTFDAMGRSFVGGGKCGQEDIFLLEKLHEPWNSRLELQKMNSRVDSMSDVALDRRSNKIYVLGNYAGPASGVDSTRLEILKFDVNSSEFSPFLPEISANEVNFSIDGKFIAYVRESDQTLWISRPDGSFARQIETQANHVELPRWSPDGRWLAFMAQRSGKPWRIFLVSSKGGRPREASFGTDNQGAPTWSPDGRWLIYGNVECQEEGTCAIHRVEIATGSVTTVPGSEGLGTARWSPDGRQIAALNPERHQVLVFDVATQRWRKLVNEVNGNDLSWSADSRYLYASRPTGDQPEIIRISLKDSRSETALDLRSFAALPGQISKWFALAPDGSVLFSREMEGKEIYSLTYVEK